MTYTIVYRIVLIATLLMGVATTVAAQGRTHSVEQRSHEMRFRAGAFRPNQHHAHGQTPSVPELDPSAAASAVALLMCVGLLLGQRRHPARRDA
jgi:hypothetical protein